MKHADKLQPPTHLGLIIDGNRRWAKEKGLPSLEGHRAGFDNLKTIAQHALDRGVKVLSAYVFSTENWQREPEEVKYLMDLLIKVVSRELEELKKKGIKIIFVGSDENVSPKVLSAIRKSEETTKNNNKGILALCFNYGGQQEIVDATKSILESGVASTNVTPELFSGHLYHPEIPPVDLVIRTSGEQRLSNFMMWRTAYSELYFSDKYWPDFTKDDLEKAFADYQARQRRHGK